MIREAWCTQSTERIQGMVRTRRQKRYSQGHPMRLKVGRYSIQIIPDNETDVAYVEEVLGLKRGGDTCECKRENAISMNALAYVEISKPDPK